jgi:hypothetical protein
MNGKKETLKLALIGKLLCYFILIRYIINEAIDLDQEFSFIESQLWNIVREIQDLTPTKKELKDGVQVLIDCYGK